MLFTTAKTKWVCSGIAGNGKKGEDGEYIVPPVEFEIEILNTTQAEKLLADMADKTLDGVGIYDRHCLRVRGADTDQGPVTDPKEFKALPGTHEYVLAVTKTIMQYGLYGDELKNA